MRNDAISTVLDKVTSETIDAQYVQRRVDDYEERPNSLYAMIGDSLPGGWEAVRERQLSCTRSSCASVGIPAQRMPTLALLNRSGDSTELEPDGLWILGTNRRVDLKCNEC